MEKESNPVLRGLYYMFKRQMITLYKENKYDYGISDSQIYAISHDCYPVFHETEEIKLYKDCFLIEKKYVDTVLKELEKMENSGHYKNYNDLEFSLGGARENRSKLIYTLRYIKLDERFDEELWNAMVDNNVSSEAKIITKPFDDSSDVFI